MSEFDAFARRELDGLLRYATVLTGDRELAHDLVQDVLLKVYRRWGQVSAADHPRAYMRTMLTRAYLSWRRTWAVRNVVLPLAELPEGPPAGDHAGPIADRDAALQRLGQLPRRQRSVLVLRYYEHLTDAEIADVLGCSAVTVRGYAARALASLRADTRPIPSVASHPMERSWTPKTCSASCSPSRPTVDPTLRRSSTICTSAWPGNVESPSPGQRAQWEPWLSWPLSQSQAAC